MDIFIESTEEFEGDLADFSQMQKADIIYEMNQVFQTLLKDPELLFKNLTLAQLRKIKLNHDYDSSLYSMKVQPEIRVILTIDDDPIFDRTLVTLFRVVKVEDALKAYNAVLEHLYQDFTIENQEIEVYSG
jgi:hypothetical protein